DGKRYMVGATDDQRRRERVASKRRSSRAKGTASQLLSNAAVSTDRLFDAVVGEFFAAASHDLKTPLTTIKGEAQLLDRVLARTGEAVDHDRIRAGLGVIDDVATRMASMVEDLLDISWLRAGRPIQLERRR